MRFPIDRQSEIPLYQQIETHLRQSILTGSLAPETRLPATRRLAADLGVNRITIESAYANLENDGLIYTRTGSGTYVLEQHTLPELTPEPPGASWPLWQQDLANTTQANHLPTPDEMLAAAHHPNPVNFAIGTGDARLFPLADFRKGLQNIIQRDGVGSVEYSERNGYAPLRSAISHVLASQGLRTHPENILITTGSQQAIALVTQLLLKPGDTVLVESPTYTGALDLFRLQRLKIVGIPTDEHGMQVDQLEKLLQQVHPKLIYTIPNFQNPTGASLIVPRRHRLLSLANLYNIPIVEDDFVSDLRYEGRPQPALKALDPGGRVIYISTFSKMLMPGLRVGFLAAGGPVIECLAETKRANDIASPTLFQRALNEFVSVGRYQAHLRRSCQLYRKRRDQMIQAITRYLPPECQFDPPKGGLFIWLKLPGSLAADQLLPPACREGVAFAPGGIFYPEGNPESPYIRLNFAIQTPEKIESGIQRLGKVIHEQIK